MSHTALEQRNYNASAIHDSYEEHEPTSECGPREEEEQGKGKRKISWREDGQPYARSSKAGACAWLEK